MVTYSLLDTSEFEAQFCVSVFVATLNNSCVGARWIPGNTVSKIGIFVPSTNVFNIITVGHMKRI